MAERSSIEWTEATWNPTRGCSRISPGCHHCYAERFARRLDGPDKPYEGLTKQTRNGPRWSGRLRLVEESLHQPLHWRRPRLIFVNSMSDLFHERVPFEFIARVFAVMEHAHWHTFQLLTKRSTRLMECSAKLKWPPNVWMGVSVENAHWLHRVDHLVSVPAHVRFLSVEPLLGPVSLSLANIHWVIVGGESGPRARPLHPDWVRSIRDQCISASVPFFFKQWGGVRKKEAGRVLDGRTWDEMPSRTTLQLAFA